MTGVKRRAKRTMLRSTKGLLTVDSTVPYSTPIAAWLFLRRLPLDDIERPSRWYERAYLAWETVRRVRNPFYQQGTGFEGYFIGKCYTSDHMTHELLALGQAMLDSNALYYRNDAAFRSTLWKTLAGESSNLEALQAWSSLLGAMLARLRHRASMVPEAGLFQAETYRMTNSVPPIRYRLSHHAIRQTYTLPFPPNDCPPKILVLPEMFPPCDQDAAFVIWTVGRLGHPLVRQYLAEKSCPQW